jgi:hypothetical protein
MSSPLSSSFNIDKKCPEGCVSFNVKNKGILLLILFSLILIVAMLITNCVVYANAKNNGNEQISEGWATFLTWINGIFAAIGILIIFLIFFKIMK